MSLGRKNITKSIGGVGAVLALVTLSVADVHSEELQSPPQSRNLLPKWQEGVLDIHHINTGRGNAAFVIMPDGTSLLVDAGDLPDASSWELQFHPLKLGPARPSDGRRPGEWIADYISQFAPQSMRQLDYAVISHFHEDHYGCIQHDSPKSTFGNWKLTGITDVAERWRIGTLIDRAYPQYDFPVLLKNVKDETLSNYLQFVDGAQKSREMSVEKFLVGRRDQIALKHHPELYKSFYIQNIASNGTVWTGKGTESASTLKAADLIDFKGHYNENPLSIMFRISYGSFSYVTGGDLPGVNEPNLPLWFDMESKVASVVGRVDALTLNHHGNRDSTNATWLGALQPRVIVQQTWTTDQPSGDVLARLNSTKIWPGERDIFATHLQDATQIALGPWIKNNYRSMAGHILIRVQAGGDLYDVFVLDDRSTQRDILAHFGPYKSRSR